MKYPRRTRPNQTRTAGLTTTVVLKLAEADSSEPRETFARSFQFMRKRLRGSGRQLPLLRSIQASELAELPPALAHAVPLSR